MDLVRSAWIQAIPLLFACNSAPGGDVWTAPADGAVADAPAADGPAGGVDGRVADAAPIDGMIAPADGCPALFDGALLADYHVDIGPAEYAALWDEFIHVVEREAAGLDINPWHPITFRWQNSDPIAAMIRLRGQSSWRQAVLFDDPPKMQFVISFNEVDQEARFMGLRKVELDMPRTDRTFLRQRLALEVLRELGVYAQCASNARLFINGAYYGLYNALERKDKEFVQRYWPDQDEGVLWQAGIDPQTNEDDYDPARIAAFWTVDSAAELAALAEMDTSLAEWAAEAVINNGDGYYGGGHNYYLYDHPTRGFLWIPHDLDFSWDHRPTDRSPLFPSRREQPFLHYLLVMNDPAWQAQYLEQVDDLRVRIEVDELQDRVDQWAAQIEVAAHDDPNRPFTFLDHLEALDRLRASIPRRAGYLDDWFDCRDAGGPDGDGDGHAFCRDCDDSDPAARPGAVEACNALDDDCDGRVDEGAGCPPPPPPPDDPPPPPPDDPPPPPPDDPPPDAAPVDAALIDAALIDAALIDAASPDAGPPPA